jgi:hypothetical protein
LRVKRQHPGPVIFVEDRSWSFYPQVIEKFNFLDSVGNLEEVLAIMVERQGCWQEVVNILPVGDYDRIVTWGD